MSSNPPPSTQPERRTALYPTATTASAPSHAMAATQIAPPGPHNHILPPPSMLADPPQRHPPPYPPPYFKPWDIPQPPSTQYDLQGHSIQHYSVHTTQYPCIPPPPPLPRDSRRVAAPLEIPRHTESYSSADSESSYAPLHQFQYSPRLATYPSSSQNVLAKRLPHETYPVREPFETSRHYAPRDENMFKSRPLPSSSYPFHANSASSQASSTISPISFGSGAASLPQPGSMGTSLRDPEDITSRYRLSVRQQPIAARACGFGERDRRVIDPPIVIQLFLTGYDPTSKSDVDELNYPKVMQVALHSEYGGIDVTSVSDPNNANKTSRRLMGSLVASSKVYIDPEATASSDANARSACLFAFFDLSCRQNGRYRLYFSLMRVNLDGLVTGGRFPIVGTVESDVFEVFSAKDFPGTRPSTPLTKALKAQGSAVSVKKGHESKQEKKTQKRSNSMSEQSGNEDSDVEEGDLAPAKSKKRR